MKNKYGSNTYLLQQMTSFLAHVDRIDKDNELKGDYSEGGGKFFWTHDRCMSCISTMRTSADGCLNRLLTVWVATALTCYSGKQAGLVWTHCMTFRIT